MRWVHLSDIHFNPKNDGRSTNQLRKELPRYLRKKRITADYLFVTGDFRHAKYQKDMDNHVVAVNAVQFILEIADALDVSPINILLVPGNHDLERTEDIKRIRNIKSAYDPNNGRFQVEDLTFLTDRFGFFKKIMSIFSEYGTKPLWSDTLLPLHTARCYTDFNLLCLNTSIICNFKNERGSLVIGNNDLYESLEAITQKNPDKPIIVLAHHGLDNLREDEKKALERIFEDYPIKLYLCGDAHQSWRRQVNNVLEITAGCLVQAPTVNTTFSVGELSESLFSIQAHLWDAAEGDWGEYTQFNNRLAQWLHNKVTPKPLAKIITRDRPVAPTAYFLGRAAKLKEIENNLYEETNIVMLCGMGGIGKSEICRQMINNYSVYPGTDLVKKLGWITYSGSLKHSFFGQFPEVKSDDVEEYWNMARQYLNREGNNLLLFIDDANTISQAEISLLSGLACKILITSRKKVDRIKVIDTGCLDISDCRKLYRKHSDDSTAPDDIIDQIILLAARHTLSVELLAKTQYSAGICAYDLLQKLLESGFNLAEIMEEITYQHNPETESTDSTEKRFIEHMSKLFDLSEIKKKSAELNLLQQFSILAPNKPISITTIKRWLELRDLNALNSVVQKGWLNRQNWNGQVSVAIHPVIASVIQYMNLPDPDSSDRLIGHVADDLVLGKKEIFTNKLDVIGHADAIIKSVSIRTENYAALLYHGAIIHTYQGEYETALNWHQIASSIRELLLGVFHTDTADSFNCIGSLYNNQGEYPKALEWHQKALKIYMNVLGEQHSNTANCFGSIGVVYFRQGNYPEALKWYQKALEIQENILEKHLDTAVTYNNIGYLYVRWGKYETALTQYQKALEIDMEILGETHPDTITVRHNIAMAYSNLGQHERALKWYQDVLTVRESVFGVNNPQTAKAYHNTAAAYFRCGKNEDALKLYTKAIEIDENILGSKHPNTADSWHGAANVYARLGEYEKALPLFQKGLQVKKLALGSNHLDIAFFYHGIASVYAYQKKYKKALKFFRKSLRIRENILGPNHFNTANTYCKIADVYFNQGKYRQAVNLYQKAIKVYAERLGTYHETTVNATKKMQNYERFCVR